MKIKGTVLESLSIVKGYGTPAVLFRNNTFYYEAGKKIKKLYKHEGDIYTAISDENSIWISSEESNSTIHIDVLDNDKRSKTFPYACSELYFHNNIALIITSGDFVEPDYDFEQELLLVDKQNNKVLFKKNFGGGLSVSLDESYFYVRSNSEKLVECYSYEFDKKWEYADLEGRIYLDFERKPQIHNDLLIINHAYDIIALNKKTGKEVWKYTFEDIPTSNILMKEKIYAVCKAQLYIIDPQNGEVLLKVDTGYPEFFPDTGQLSRDKNHIGIFPVGDYLYGIARSTGTGKQIRLYNKDCSKILYEADWNKENQEQYYLNPYASIMPTIRGNKIYQPLRNFYSFSDSGILVMELTEDEAQAGIKVAPRPPVTMVANPSLNVPHKLQVFLDVNNLDDALRYGDLLTKELQFATGYIAAYDERENALDTKHNGELELIIDNAGFEEGSENFLNNLSGRLKEFLESDTCAAGNKKTAIKFTLLTQAKAEWDKSGEQLDWPAIRQQETPLI